ncbi:unnamed protein product, partial [Brassica rapa subsp. trilocularis]
FSGDHSLLVSGSQDGSVRVWSLIRLSLFEYFSFNFCFNALALDPGGSVFYAGGGDGKIYIGALNSKSDYVTQFLGSVSDPSTKSTITCLAYCADGNLLISRSEGGVIWVWNPRSRQPVRSFTFGHGKGPVNNIQDNLPGKEMFLRYLLLWKNTKEKEMMIPWVQQGSAATEIEMERLKLEYKKSIQMNDQWQKNYENLLQVVMEQELNGGSN